MTVGIIQSVYPKSLSIRYEESGYTIHRIQTDYSVFSDIHIDLDKLFHFSFSTFRIHDSMLKRKEDNAINIQKKSGYVSDTCNSMIRKIAVAALYDRLSSGGAH